MTKVSLPDGAEITYTYDDAHRLTAITDKAGQQHPLHARCDGQPDKRRSEGPNSGNLAADR